MITVHLAGIENVRCPVCGTASLGDDAKSLSAPQTEWDSHVAFVYDTVLQQIRIDERYGEILNYYGINVGRLASFIGQGKTEDLIGVQIVQYDTNDTLPFYVGYFDGREIISTYDVVYLAVGGEVITRLGFDGIPTEADIRFQYAEFLESCTEEEDKVPYHSVNIERTGYVTNDF